MDIYALGLTLVELLLGEPADCPSRALTEFRAAQELLSRRSRPGWPALTAARVSPARLGEIAARCLGPDTEAKYIDAGDMARSLGRFLASSATSRSRSIRYISA